MRFRARPDRQLVVTPDLPIPVRLCPLASARRMRLRFDERSGTLKLTHPSRISGKRALAWAASQKAWIEEQLSSAIPAEPFAPGLLIPIDGEEVELCWSELGPRRPALCAGKLTCGGALQSFSGRIERFLKARALERLSLETAEFAAMIGVHPAAVAVGDAKTRWGSCSSARRIRYSWRLILAPPEARRFVVAHEVAHLLHLDHGREFKLLEAQLFGGDIAAARLLLRRVGPPLRSLGRGR